MYTHTDISLSKKFNYLRNNAAKKKLSMKFKNNLNPINLKKNLNINNGFMDNMRDVDHENEVSCIYLCIYIYICLFVCICIYIHIYVRL
jgi:hypothetical protein